MKKIILTYSLLFIAYSLLSQTYTINTIAGDSTQGFAGDNGAATAAELYYPTDIAVDGAGNVYVADNGSLRVRKVSAGGVITTIAGNGTIGFSGDNGAATAAELNGPYGVAIDGSGNIYIADAGNNRIRKVNTSGIITTIAGNGTAGFAGDNGAAIAAELNFPTGIKLDNASNLFVADFANNRIRRISTAGIITTIAGNGTTGFSGDNGAATASELWGPAGIAVDGIGNVYIADQSNERIRKVNTSGVITTIAGNGTYGFSGDNVEATTAELNGPSGITVDGTGNIYIADQVNNRIRMVNTGGIIITIAGNAIVGFSGDNGAATIAELDRPNGVALNTSGNVYIADLFNNRIRELTLVEGINEISYNLGEINVYPNPSKGIFTIQSSAASQQPLVEVYNMLGERIYNSQFLIPIAIGINSKFLIDLSGQPPGIYLYRVLSEKGELMGSGKLIIQ